MREARLYTTENDLSVYCHTCAHGCKIPNGKRGFCGVMENREGRLFSLVYGKVIAMHTDPIEKKPLFHFYPGSPVFSIATAGCNLHCQNCQNADISQMPVERRHIAGREMSSEEVVRAAQHQHCRSIAYTYTEPAIFWDFAYDTARLASSEKMSNVFVSNGYFSEDSFSEISDFMDAANVDLKFFRDDNYKKYCRARLVPVLRTIERMHDAGVWIEITTLLIPGLNDSDEELKEIAEFILHLDAGIPWHISRFHPAYKMQNRQVTPVSSLRKACEIGKETGLLYVYTGNVPGEDSESTFCPSCGSRLIHRFGFQIVQNNLHAGHCPQCGKEIHGRW